MHENWGFLKNISKSVTVWHTKKTLAKSIYAKTL